MPVHVKAAHRIGEEPISLGKMQSHPAITVDDDQSIGHGTQGKTAVRRNHAGINCSLAEQVVHLGRERLECGPIPQKQSAGKCAYQVMSSLAREGQHDMDPVIGKLPAAGEQHQRILLHFHQANAVLLDVESLIKPEGITEQFLRAPDIDRPHPGCGAGFGGMKAEKPFVGLKIDTFAGGLDRPDIIKLAVLGFDVLHERAVLHLSAFVRFQISQHSGGTGIDPAVFIFGERSAKGMVGIDDQPPVRAVEFLYTIAIPDIHQPAFILFDGPELGVAAELFAGIHGHKWHAGFSRMGDCAEQ